jgi:hypothetical protein
MSGGYYDYLCYKVMELCDQMDHAIKKFTKPEMDEWNPGYSKEHMELRQKFVDHLRKVADLVHTIEFTDSGDYGADREVKELEEFFKGLK